MTQDPVQDEANRPGKQHALPSVLTSQMTKGFCGSCFSLEHVVVPVLMGETQHLREAEVTQSVSEGLPVPFQGSAF